MQRTGANIFYESVTGILFSLAVNSSVFVVPIAGTYKYIAILRL